MFNFCIKPGSAGQPLTQILHEIYDGSFATEALNKCIPQAARPPASCNKTWGRNMDDRIFINKSILDILFKGPIFLFFFETEQKTV